MKLRRTIKILAKSLGILLLLVALLLFLLHQPATQRWLTPKLENWLANKLETEVKIDGVGVQFPKALEIQGVVIKTPQGDSLLEVGSLVVDMDMWALFNNEITIQKIALHNAYVNLHQEGGSTNFDFLLQAFAPPAEDGLPPTPTDTSGGFRMVMKPFEVDFENVAFRFNDVDNQQFINARVGSLFIQADETMLDSFRFSISQLTVEDSDISFKDLAPVLTDSVKASTFFDFFVKSGDINNTKIFYETSDLLLNTKLNDANLEALVLQSTSSGIVIKTKALELAESDLVFQQKNTAKTPGRFNAADLALTSLRTELRDFSYQDLALKVDVVELMGVDKSGLDLRNLSGKIAYTPTSVSLQNIDLEANTTTLVGDVALQIGALGQPPIVQFEADLQKAGGQIGDLLQFLPDGPAYADFRKLATSRWSASGRLEGNMNKVFADKLQLSFGKNSRLEATGSIANLNAPNLLNANLQLRDFHFVKSDFVPFLRGMNLPLPSFAEVSGSVRGTAGRLNLNLSGNFGQFDTLAASPTTSEKGLFRMSGKIQGLSSPKSLQMDLDIQQLEAPGSHFAVFAPANITLPNRFSAVGKLKGSMADMFADLQLNAQRAGASSNLLVRGNFQQLDNIANLQFDAAVSGKLTKEEIRGYVPDSLLSLYLKLPAIVSVDGSAKGTLENLTAALNLVLGDQGALVIDGYRNGNAYGAKIEGKQLKVNQLAADSLIPQMKMLNISAELVGEGFDFGNTATLKLTSKIPSMTWEDWTFENTVLNGNLLGKKFDVVMSSPDPRLHLQLAANGDLGGARPKLEWNALFDCFDLQAFGLTEKSASACFRVRGNADGLSDDALDAVVFLEGIQLQLDSLKLNPGDVRIETALHQGNNDLAISSDWLNAWLRGYFDPSKLPGMVDNFSQHYFKTRAGSIPSQTNQSLRSDTLAFAVNLAHPALFSTGFFPGLSDLDSLTMHGNLDSRSYRFRFDTNLPHADYEQWGVNDLSFHADGNGEIATFRLNIPSVTQYEEPLVQDLSFAGTLDGKRAEARLTALDSLGQDRYRIGFFAETSDFLDGYSVHFLPTQFINYEDWAVPPTNSVTYSGPTMTVKDLHLTNGEQALRIDGTSTLLDDGNRTLGLKVELQRLDISTFEALLVGILKDPTGWLDGQFNIGGTLAAPKPSGNLSLQKVQATVALTNVRYSLSDKQLVLNPEGIDLTGLSLTDPQGNRLNINGMLLTTNWSGFQFDLRLSANNWMVMNSVKTVDAEYYGKLVANVNGTVQGPLAQPRITLAVSPVKGSLLHYIYDDTRNKAEGNGVVVFVQPGGNRVKQRQSLSKKFPYYLNLQLEINDNLELDVVADPVSGDNFEGTLDGRLNLEIFPDGKMNLAGRCEVLKGTYRFTYQQIVRRRFEVSPGSYLAWSGDPFNPDLQVTARYVVRTSPYPLLLNWGAGIDVLNSSAGKSFQTFFLNFKVTGELLRPELVIDLEYPDTDSETFSGTSIQENSGNNDIEAAINSLNQDAAQLSQQVFSLLIFNRFNGETGGYAANSQNAIAAGLNSFLTTQFNALADRYFKFVDIQLETNEDATFGEDNNYTATTNYNLRLQKSFFNDRLVFKVSGGAAEDRGTSTQWRSTLENVSVEYSLTQKGTFKLRAFSEDGLELLNTEESRNSGSGVLFTKEFKRLFRRKDAKKNN